MRRLTFLLILLLAAAARFHALGADLRFDGDEAWFATFARNAAVHGDWWLTGPLDKPPLPMYLMALSMQFMGVVVNANGVLDLDLRMGEWVARLPSAFAGVITCAAFMVFVRRISRDGITVFLAGMIWALSPLAVEFDSVALTDALMMAGFSVSLAAAVHGRAGLAGAAWVLAFASKQQAIFLLPLILALVFLPMFAAKKGHRLRFLVATGLGLGLLFLWDAIRVGESINAIAAVNNNPYRTLADPLEWAKRARFWGNTLGMAFGAFGAHVLTGGWLFYAASLFPFAMREKGLEQRHYRVRYLLITYSALYIIAHLVLPFNLYERYSLPAALLLTLPIAAVIAWLSRGRKRLSFPLLMAVMLLIPIRPLATPHDTDSDIIDLATFVNQQGLGTIVYNRWLGWEMGYYLGAWSDKRVVYYPTPEDFEVDAPKNPDTAPRLMIAPRWAAFELWLSAAENAGFEVEIAFENKRYVAWTLIPQGVLSEHVVGADSSGQTAGKFHRRGKSPRVLSRTHQQAACPTIERTTFYSDILQGEIIVSVYLPCMPDEKPLPYLIFLHGSNKEDRHLLDLGLEQAAPPFAVVMPFGGELANTNEFGEISWGNVLLDLMDDFEEKFPLDSSRRAIGGISRGGFWAYHVGLRHPEMFRAIGGHSAFFDLYHAPDEANPLDLALTLNPAAAPALYLDRGANDYAAPGLDIMDARLRRADVPHTYLIHPTGEHDDSYWAAHLPDYIEFYAQALMGEPVPTTTPAPEVASGIALFVPAAAFPSPWYDLSLMGFANVLQGNFDPKLTVSEATRAALSAYGVVLSPDIKTLDTAEAVQNDLFRDRSRWTILPWGALNLRLRVLMIGGQHPVDILESGYALAFESDTPDFDPNKLSRVMISGVTALARGTTVALDSNGVEWAAEALAPLTTRADIFHISSEASAIEGCPSVDAPRLGGNSSFCAKPEHLRLFSLLGADLIELSGNHNNDYGYQAYDDTLDALHAEGFATVGGGRTLAAARTPFIWQGAGGSVAWLACNAVGPYYAMVDEAEPRPGATSCDGDWLRAELPRLKAAYDVVILTVQYLEFDQHNPTDAQRRDFATYASWGADYVGGTQAHFPQSLNIISGYGGEDAFVHYGLGNFVFDQTFWAGVRFLLDELYIYDGRLHSVAVYAGIIEGQGRPRLMTADERDNFWYVLFNQHGEF